MKRITQWFLISISVCTIIPMPVFALDDGLDMSSQSVEQMSANDAGEVVSTSQPTMIVNNEAERLSVSQEGGSPASDMTATQASVTEPSSLPTPLTTRLLISEVRLRGCLESSLVCDANTQDGSFIELYNPSPATVTVSGWQLQYSSAGSAGKFGDPKPLATIDLTLEGYSYGVIGRTGLVAHDAPLLPLIGAIGSKSQGYVQLLTSDNQAVDLLGWGGAALLAEGGSPARASDSNNSMQRCEDASGLITDTDNNMNDFLQYDIATPGTGMRCSASPPPPAAQVNNCMGIIISEIAANTTQERQFIELHNTTSQDISLRGCVLQTNRSTTKSLILPDEIVVADGDIVIFLDGTDLVLTKTTTGTVYLLSSDGQTETDVREYAQLAADTSWAWFGEDVWQQTYTLTPGSTNNYQQYAACDEGYERNLETGRCNKMILPVAYTPCADNQYRSEETGRCRTVVLASAAAPCKDGQYRSEETNRCRNLALAGSTLLPCKDNQYRSEETNRCRTIAAASTNLVPCKDNQYRSEATNRCRTIAATAIPEASFAVTPMKETGKAFVGWWALGGVGLLAGGYGIWEWRREMLAGLRRVGVIMRHRH